LSEALKTVLKSLITTPAQLVKEGGGTYDITVFIDNFRFSEWYGAPAGILEPGDMRGFFLAAYGGVSVETGDWLVCPLGTFRVLDVRTWDYLGESIYKEATLRKVP